MFVVPRHTTSWSASLPSAESRSGRRKTCSSRPNSSRLARDFHGIFDGDFFMGQLNDNMNGNINGIFDRIMECLMGYLIGMFNGMSNGMFNGIFNDNVDGNC